MTKKLISAIFMLLSVQLMWADDAKQIFAEFKDAKNAKYAVYIPCQSIEEQNTDVFNNQTLAEKTNSINTLNLEDCSNKVKKRFIKRIDKLTPDTYEALILSQQVNNKKMLLIRKEGTSIKEVLFIFNHILIQYTGDFEESDIIPLTQEETIKKYD